MNCLEFRRRLLADPLATDDQLHGHEGTCPTCANFARDARAQEIQLRNMLKQTKPPPGLADRIQLAARFEQRSLLQRRGWYAVAASMLVAISISMLSLWNTAIERRDLALTQSVLHHIDDEAHHLREAHAIPAARVDWVFRRFGARLAEDIGRVNFAAECLMRHKNGVHLVMPGKMGPITVFFMPGEMTDKALEIESARFHGKIVPTDWGSVAVIGEQGEPLQGLGQRLAAAVSWPAHGSAESVALRRGGGSDVDLAVGVGVGVFAGVGVAQQKNG